MGLISNLPAHSKIWVYTADRRLTEQEMSAMQERLNNFTSSWTAHEMSLNASAGIFYNQVVVIALNEAFQSVSGCGIDKSVNLMKDLGAQFGIDFFNRLLVMVKEGDALITHTKSSIQQALNAGLLEENTEVFNSMHQTLGDFESQPFVALRSFWMAPQLNFPVQS